MGVGAKKVELKIGSKSWAFSSLKYLQPSVNNVEFYFEEKCMKFPSKYETPITTSYRPEINVSPELVSNYAVYYQSIIGVPRFIVKLG